MVRIQVPFEAKLPYLTRFPRRSGSSPASCTISQPHIRLPTTPHLTFPYYKYNIQNTHQIYKHNIKQRAPSQTHTLHTSNPKATQPPPHKMGTSLSPANPHLPPSTHTHPSPPHHPQKSPDAFGTNANKHVRPGIGPGCSCSCGTSCACPTGQCTCKCTLRYAVVGIVFGYGDC